MAAIASLLIVLTMSRLVTRVGAMALMLTGMSRESARFQARSAFTGVGFPTSEAEEVVAHPVRRRIVMLLMLLGNLGIGAVIATLMLSFMTAARAPNSRETWVRLFALAGGMFLLWKAANNRFLERHLNRVIAWGLSRWGKLQLRDYVAILQLHGGYAVSELLVEPNDWLTDRSLIELRLPDEGVLVLGVRRAEGAFLGTPTGETVIHARDTLILYGPVERIEELDQRRRGKRGEAARREAVEEHEMGLKEQEEMDEQIQQRRQTEVEGGHK